MGQSLSNVITAPSVGASVNFGATATPNMVVTVSGQAPAIQVPPRGLQRQCHLGQVGVGRCDPGAGCVRCAGYGFGSGTAWCGGAVRQGEPVDFGAAQLSGGGAGTGVGGRLTRVGRLQ